MATHVFDFYFQIADSTGSGALEGHVLQKVSCSVGGVAFVSAASINPNTNSCGAGVRDSLGDDTETVGKAGYL